MLNKVRIKLKSDIRSKLAFVKAVKVYTGWGLKESKDFTDTLCDDFRNKRERSSELILKNSHDFKSNRPTAVGINARTCRTCKYNIIRTSQYRGTGLILEVVPLLR